MANAAFTNIVTVLEHSRISPPHDLSVAENVLPLTFFDMLWLNWPSPGRVYFYDFPCSITEFKQTLVPHLKKSLASTLKHYYPLCGNLMTPATLTDTTTPAIRYLNGDSVSLTVAEFTGTTCEGFGHLSGNHAREVDKLFALVPELPPRSTDTDHVSPVLSLQVTLFPDHGYSVGYRISHVVADGKTLSNFIRTWASINVKQLIGEDNYDGNLDTLPFYDRSVIKDSKGIASIFLRNSLRTRHQKDYEKAFAPAAHNDLVEATLILNQEEIQGLKNLVSALPHVSKFVVVCAYVWTCMAKTRAALGPEMNDENQVEAEHFIFAMDARDRVDPPIPSNYFGNTILPCWATLESRQLVGEKGFVSAVEEIRNALNEKINNEEGPLKGLEMYFDRNQVTKGQTKFGVAGSPKLDYYGTDFGWGKPKKYEIVSEKFGLIGSKNSQGGLELGFCFSRTEMDTFTAIFTQGLRDYALT